MSTEALAEGEPTDVDYRVRVAFTVPVATIVDLREGRVDRVVVMNEEVELDAEEGACQEGTLHPVPSAVAKRATEIALSSAVSATLLPQENDSREVAQSIMRTVSNPKLNKRAFDYVRRNQYEPAAAGVVG